MRKNPSFTLLAAGLLLLTVAGRAQAEAPEGSAGMTQEQGAALLEELKQIRVLLERIEAQGQPPSAPPPQRPAPGGKVSVSIKDAPVLGKADAPVTLVEFVDYQCAFCQRFFKDTYPKLKQEYVDTGRLRILVKDMPLGFHKEARSAAHAARCAGDQGRYWAMHDRLFETRKLTDADLASHAEAIGMDKAAYDACMSSGRHLAQIDRDSADAREAGVSGTPSFVVGATAGDRLTGSAIRGALPTAVFTQQIEEALAGRDTP